MAAGQGTSLKTYLLTRLTLVVPMVLILLTFVFLLMRVAPGDLILTNGAATLELTFFAMIVAVVVGVLVGLLAGRFRDTPIDVGGRLFGIVVYATPVFFLGLMAQLVFGVWLNWLPTSDQSSPITQATLPD